MFLASQMLLFMAVCKSTSTLTIKFLNLSVISNTLCCPPYRLYHFLVFFLCYSHDTLCRNPSFLAYGLKHIPFDMLVYVPLYPWYIVSWF